MRKIQGAHIDGRRRTRRHRLAPPPMRGNIRGGESLCREGNLLASLPRPAPSLPSVSSPCPPPLLFPATAKRASAPPLQWACNASVGGLASLPAVRPPRAPTPGHGHRGYVTHKAVRLPEARPGRLVPATSPRNRAPIASPAGHRRPVHVLGGFSRRNEALCPANPLPARRIGL